MKTSAEKSSTTTSKPASRQTTRPFFVRAGEGDFFASTRSAIVPSTRTQSMVHNVRAPSRTLITPVQHRDSKLQKQDNENKRDLRVSEENHKRKIGEGASDQDADSRLSQPAEARQSPLLQQAKSQEYSETTRRTPSDVRQSQPAADVAGGGPSASKHNEAENAVAPINSMQQTTGNGKANDRDNTEHLGRIVGAPQSPAKIQALAQAQLINSDYVQSTSQVSQIASTRRQQVSNYFSGARQSLTQFFITSVIAVQTLIAGKQAEIITAMARTLVWIRTAISGALATASTIAQQIRARINQTLENITTTVQNRVQGIAGRITGLIDSIPLPDIPGIGQIRARAVGMLNRAAGFVNRAFGRFVGFVSRAFNAGMNLLGSFLNIITRFANLALSLATTAILNVMQMFARTINVVMAFIGSTLRGILFAVIFPILSSIEGMINRLISIVEQRAIGLLQRNRDEYLSALADIVAPLTPAGSVAVSTLTLIDVIRQLGQHAIQASRLIVQTVLSSIGAAIVAVIQAVAAEILRNVTMITGLVAQMIRMIIASFIRGIQMLVQLIQTMSNFLRELIRTLTTAVQNLVAYMSSLIRRGANQLLQFVRNGLGQLINFLRRFVQNLILGRGVVESFSDALGEFNPSELFDPTQVPVPFPIPFPIPSPGPAPVPVPAPTPSPTPVPGPKPVPSPSPVPAPTPRWLIILIVVIILIIIILLLYLLWRWLTKPKRPKKPRPKIIKHETTFSAPDGSPKTRINAGVGEEVVFTGNMVGAWTADSGRPRTGSGSTFTWNAPERAASARINLTVGSESDSVVMKVIEPNKIKAIKMSENTYPSGTQGAGMMLDFVFHPLKVSFGNAETREVAGPASNITGYYLHHGMPHDHNPGPLRFFRISEKNRFQAARDQAAQSGYPSPWDKGSFHWVIPNKFKVTTESGDGKEYTTVTQAFKMVNSRGKTIVTKAGAKVERTP